MRQSRWKSEVWSPCSNNLIVLTSGGIDLRKFANNLMLHVHYSIQNLLIWYRIRRKRLSCFTCEGVLLTSYQNTRDKRRIFSASHLSLFRRSVMLGTHSATFTGRRMTWQLPRIVLNHRSSRNRIIERSSAIFPWFTDSSKLTMLRLEKQTLPRAFNWQIRHALLICVTLNPGVSNWMPTRINPTKTNQNLTFQFYRVDVLGNAHFTNFFVNNEDAE